MLCSLLFVQNRKVDVCIHCLSVAREQEYPKHLWGAVVSKATRGGKFPSEIQTTVKCLKDNHVGCTIGTARCQKIRSRQFRRSLSCRHSSRKAAVQNDIQREASENSPDECPDGTRVVRISLQALQASTRLELKYTYLIATGNERFGGE